MNTTRIYHVVAAANLITLIFLCIAWELILAPLRPGGSWMVLKVLPLLLPLRGVLKHDVYTLQWSSMLILLYLAEGIVHATSDTAMATITLGWTEVALSCFYFLCVILYLHPHKRAAKKLAQQAIHQAHHDTYHAP